MSMVRSQESTRRLHVPLTHRRPRLRKPECTQEERAFFTGKTILTTVAIHETVLIAQLRRDGSHRCAHARIVGGSPRSLRPNAKASRRTIEPLCVLNVVSRTMVAST